MKTLYYHASSVPGIKQLEPQISEHGVPLVYLSSKRENVLVYLSNAVEKYCRETGFEYEGKRQKWGPYGFDRDGKLYLEEYYPDALVKTYKGVSGYIYSAEDAEDSGVVTGITDAITSSKPVEVTGMEFIPDALEAILQAESEGLIRIVRYREMTDKKKIWLKKVIWEEYVGSEAHPEYRHFLRGCFSDFFGNC